MNAIVIGAGKLGFEVAKRLSEDGHDVVVVDRDEGALAEVSEHLDVLTVPGNGASPAVLQKAGVERADIVLAVTEVDEVNMIACMTAKQLAASAASATPAAAGAWGGLAPSGGRRNGASAQQAEDPGLLEAPRPICGARIRNPEYTGQFPYTRSLRQLGIDVVINPDRLTALEIARLIRTPWATHVDFFLQGRVGLICLRVAEGAPITQGTLSEVSPNALVAAVVREGVLTIPTGQSRVRAGDRVYIVGKTGNFTEVRNLVGSPGRPLKEVTIVGGGKVGLPLAQILLPSVRKGLRLKLIDRDPQRCNHLAAELPGVLVICGDGEKIDVLRDEMVQHSHVFVAVTGEDHTNLLSAMVAKQLGVSETIVRISREDYGPLAERAGADVVVVPRLIAASTALQLVRPRHVLSLSLLEEGKAQVLEMVVAPDSAGANRRLRDLEGFRDAIVGAIARRDELIIPTGEMTLLPGDRLLLFALPAAVPRVEALLGARVH